MPKCKKKFQLNFNFQDEKEGEHKQERGLKEAKATRLLINYDTLLMNNELFTINSIKRTDNL